MKRKIVIGLSGGVDSSVAAYLLKKKGWDVVGVTLKFYPQENRCCDLDSLYQAQRLCHKLEIPHYIIDVGQFFRHKVINYFIESYLQGLTPNPCAYCNRFIKFGIFLDKAKSLGVKYLATGHYAQVVKKGSYYLLKKNKDAKKSQEYFLSLIKPEILESLVFPLANYTKAQVKKIAVSKGLIFKEREESQDVCFVPDKNYSTFIEENIADERSYRGNICHVNGKILGKHKGIYNYTYGQRAGLGISWTEPLYVIKIDPESKDVVVGQKNFLDKDRFLVKSLNWFVRPEKYRKLTVRVRYNSTPVKCSIGLNNGQAVINLKEKISAITPGQIAAFYCKDLLLGAGVIAKY